MLIIPATRNPPFPSPTYILLVLFFYFYPASYKYSFTFLNSTTLVHFIILL
jgi:hypothetical protein